jgi:hypothetical protein|nr:hypothetical protein [Bradyrhizobium sp.]
MQSIKVIFARWARCRRGWRAETDGGIRIAGPELERALKALSPAAGKKR